jgi:hypothetical protein
MGFGHVVAVDLLPAAKAGDGAGDFQDAIVRAGAEIVVGHCVFKEVTRGFIQFAMGLQLARAHAGIASDALFTGGAWFAICERR